MSQTQREQHPALLGQSRGDSGGFLDQLPIDVSALVASNCFRLMSFMPLEEKRFSDLKHILNLSKVSTRQKRAVSAAFRSGKITKVPKSNMREVAELLISKYVLNTAYEYHEDTLVKDEGEGRRFSIFGRASSSWFLKLGMAYRVRSVEFNIYSNSSNKVIFQVLDTLKSIQITRLGIICGKELSEVDARYLLLKRRYDRVCLLADPRYLPHKKNALLSRCSNLPMFRYECDCWYSEGSRHAFWEMLASLPRLKAVRTNCLVEGARQKVIPVLCMLEKVVLESTVPPCRQNSLNFAQQLQTGLAELTISPCAFESGLSSVDFTFLRRCSRLTKLDVPILSDALPQLVRTVESWPQLRHFYIEMYAGQGIFEGNICSHPWPQGQTENFGLSCPTCSRVQHILSILQGTGPLESFRLCGVPLSELV